MIAYKIMRTRHYKEGSTVHTSQVNYGNRISRIKANQELADAAIEICSLSEVSFEQMITLLFNLQNGVSRLQLPPSITAAQAVKLAPLVQSAPAIQNDFGATFWEALYERVRREERSTCPSRLKSYFASRDVDSLRRYRDEHWANKMGDKIICEVDVSECLVAFEADMVILDKVSHGMNFQSAKPHVLRYWDQEMSPKPNLETLLQGTVALGRQISL